MRRNRKNAFFGPFRPFAHRRLNFDANATDGGPVEGTSGGVSTAPAPDIEPTNGGPERDFDPGTAGASESGPEPAATGGTPAPATPADPNQAAGAGNPAQTAAEWRSIRDAAQSYGYAFDPNIKDDHAALVHLIQQANSNRQADYYAQLGRQLAPQAPAIQQYLANQAKPQAPAERQPWEAPEFDERWGGLVDRDAATGLFVGKPGVPAEIVQKVNTYAEWKTKFDRDPAAVINGMVEARAKDIAGKTFDERFAEQARQQTIQTIVAENSAWLYAVDAAGQRVLNPVTNQYTPSPNGARYLQHLSQVHQMGVRDPRQADALAKNLVRGELAMQAAQSSASGTQQAADPQTRQAAGVPNRNPLQADPPTRRAQNPAATEPSGAGLSFAEMLRRDFAAEGITDRDFANAE